jgi:hypothetical protein
LPVGWKQKLAFGVHYSQSKDCLLENLPEALILPPDVILGIDLSGCDKGITVFVTTHYMTKPIIATEISIMVDGKIAVIDKPQTLKMQYHEQYG